MNDTIEVPPATPAPFPMAVGGPGPLVLTIEARIPEFPSLGASREYFSTEAERFVAALEQHAPGGLVDAIFGVLAARKASIFHVANPAVKA